MSERTNYDQVGDFHEKFDLDNVTHRGNGPRKVPKVLMDFRIKFLKEELREFEDARDANDEAKMADALVDLVYVALGTAHLMGLPWEDLFAEVQRANMTKIRATHESQSARASTFDVIKPPGWTPPRIEEVLNRFGWAFSLPLFED